MNYAQIDYKMRQLKDFLANCDYEISFKELLLAYDLIAVEKEVKDQIRKIYRKWYNRRWKRNHRSEKAIYEVSFSQKEDCLIICEAARYRKSKPQLIKKAALAYLNQEFLVPNEEQIGILENQMAFLISEFDYFSSQLPGEAGHLLGNLKTRLLTIEQTVSGLLRNPEKVTPSRIPTLIAPTQAALAQ